MLDQLASGRAAYARRAWNEAYQSLADADRAAPLDVDDLERLATSAYLTGRDVDFHRCLDRAHRLHVEAGNPERAARCAFWLGVNLLLSRETGQAGGWFARGQRLIDGRDCAARGYLLLPVAEQHLAEDRADAAGAVASAAAEIGVRFGDADLSACGRHVQGRALIARGDVPAGLALLDEAMLAAIAGDLSPIMTGLIYCSVIGACQEVYAVRRAREWTAALSGWCEQQSEMVFTGTCLVYRAAVMQFCGAWPDAMAEANRACAIFQRAERRPPAAAFYQQGEIHRLRGEFAEAEDAYRRASQSGWEPQPGLALLRMAQGRTDAASAAIRRVVCATTDRFLRAKLLPAYLEIMLAAGAIEDARVACRELQELLQTFDTDVWRAIAAHARGAVALADDDARAALAPLRCAFEAWEHVEAPYEAARVRVRRGQACRALGDEEAAALEFAAARAVFARLGAQPDLARLEALDAPDALGARAPAAPQAQAPRNPLTLRERDVLRLIAAGNTNRAVAAELHVSERTVDRHVSNIFGKLDVSSRAAATAAAYERKLL